VRLRRRLSFPRQVQGLFVGFAAYVLLVGAELWLAAGLYGVGLAFAMYRAMRETPRGLP